MSAVVLFSRERTYFFPPFRGQHGKEIRYPLLVGERGAHSPLCERKRASVFVELRRPTRTETFRRVRKGNETSDKRIERTPPPSRPSRSSRHITGTLI